MNHPVTWVKLEKYAALTGDTAEAVNNRRKVGKWLDGIQCKVVDRHVWVNLVEAEKWVSEWQPNRQLRVA